MYVSYSKSIMSIPNEDASKSHITIRPQGKKKIENYKETEYVIRHVAFFLLASAKCLMFGVEI